LLLGIVEFIIRNGIECFRVCIVIITFVIKTRSGLETPAPRLTARVNPTIYGPAPPSLRGSGGLVWGERAGGVAVAGMGADY